MGSIPGQHQTVCKSTSQSQYPKFGKNKFLLARALRQRGQVGCAWKVDLDSTVGVCYSYWSGFPFLLCLVKLINLKKLELSGGLVRALDHVRRTSSGCGLLQRAMVNVCALLPTRPFHLLSNNCFYLQLGDHFVFNCICSLPCVLWRLLGISNWCLQQHKGHFRDLDKFYRGRTRHRGLLPFSSISGSDGRTHV